MKEREGKEGRKELKGRESNKGQGKGGLRKSGRKGKGEEGEEL